MITVYYRKTDFLLEEEAFRHFMEASLEKIEEKRRRKILRMHRREEQIRSLAAGMLLRQALCERTALSPESPPFEVEYESGGKPFLRDFPQMHFNLSHSGDYVCLALGECPVGVDIQEKTRIREGIARRFFTEADNRKLSECGQEERKDLFFRMWSIKESYVKLTGEGIGAGLSGFEIDWKESALCGSRSLLQEKEILEACRHRPAAYFREWQELEGYALCVCFRDQDQEVVWRELSG